MKILIVEDNVFVALFLEEELRAAGFEVVGPAMASDQAWEIAVADDCEAAVVDIDLRDGATGGELACRLANEKGIPVVFATGQRDLAEKYADCALGMLHKPVDSPAIVETMHAVQRLLESEFTGDFREVDWPNQFEPFSDTFRPARGAGGNKPVDTGIQAPYRN